MSHGFYRLPTLHAQPSVASALPGRLLAFLGMLLGMVMTLAITGCSVNPVTGKQELSLISEAQELSIGSEQYLPSRQSQGGDYVVDPEVEAYVQEVGNRLVRVSDRQLPYEFHVINSSVPNAWALPGGKLAINRGLLTELNSEAELAAVLGHEIVHAAARHGAQSMQRGLLLQGAVLGTALATQDESYAQLAMIGASVGSQLVNTKYGREAERESDLYGMIYMSRAGYDPQGAIDLQETFVKLSEGQQSDWLQGLFASHPPSQERVDNNRQLATTLAPGGEVGKQRYRNRMARLNRAKPAYEAYDQAAKALSDKDTGKARSLVAKAISLEPKEGHFHALLGDIESKQNNPSKALSHYSKAISLNGNFFYYHLRRGLVNESLNNPASAKKDLEASTRLLPTATAFNALGNLARTAGNEAQAKEYYAKAAGQNNAAGQAALASLVELDLPDNPGNYLKITNQRDGSGQWQLLINNPTPRDVTDLVVELRYPDGAGRQLNRQIRVDGTLPKGSSKRLNLGLAINPQLSQYYQSTLISARLAP